MLPRQVCAQPCAFMVDEAPVGEAIAALGDIHAPNRSGPGIDVTEQGPVDRQKIGETGSFAWLGQGGFADPERGG